MYINVRAIIERTTPEGTEVLLQVRDRQGEPHTLELPGGRLEEFEPILDGLAREIVEETGLRVTEILGDSSRTIYPGTEAHVECLVPFFAYQTIVGPADSMGFFFRCRAEGELVSRGDGTFGHRWVQIEELERMFLAAPDDFHWVTQGALKFYFKWRRTVAESALVARGGS